jgi:GNAT superfamily N-acetyltransferase
VPLSATGPKKNIVQEWPAKIAATLSRSLKRKSWLGSPSCASIQLQRIVVADPGHGIGRQMLAGILDYVFQELKAHRLWLDVFETNKRAQHVYERLGFRREGILREAIFRDGEFHTQVLMSILDREYEAL